MMPLDLLSIAVYSVREVPLVYTAGEGSSHARHNLQKTSQA
jgi:hypothetical protein